MIKINCKEGVWFKFIDYRFLELARIVYRVYQKYGIEPTVTSACDSTHMANSYHYQGLGWDFRIWGLPDPQAVANEIREEAQKLDFHYDIVFGDSRHLDHIHTEWDERKEV